MICYSNNGFSFRAVNDNYVAQQGEAIFPDYATDGQLETAFPGYKAQKEKNDSNNAIVAQITALEAQQTDRRVREAVLGVDNGWLANLNSQITVLRTQLK